MSAKSSTFAAEMIDFMELKQMTHTCYRCRHSFFVGVPALLDCPHRKSLKQEGECNCRNWLPSLMAESYFGGTLKGNLHGILTGIYVERVKRGTF